mmetsp:Transcript_22034/g.32551  ORF Transcript_22034/g.32551 Transcript_22034/m.32551 type:complete len:107 (-) Transcript_22034:567-887(-)
MSIRNIMVGMVHVRVKGIMYKNGIVISTRALSCSLNPFLFVVFVASSISSECVSPSPSDDDIFSRRHHMKQQQQLQQHFCDGVLLNFKIMEEKQKIIEIVQIITDE